MTIAQDPRLAKLLVAVAVVCGITTWAVLTGKGPAGLDTGGVLVLLSVDLVLVLLLSVVVARRLVRIWAARRKGSAGSGLEGRLVALFGLLAVTPAIVVTLFSVWFLHVGVNAWFSDRVREAVDTSLQVAQAYLEEHRENIRADALAMAADINREGRYGRSLQDLVEAHAMVRSLTEAVVFDTTGAVLARSELAFSMDIGSIEPADLERAAAGEVVTLTADTDDRVRALVRLDGFGDAYLFVGRFVDPSVLNLLERTQAGVSDYEAAAAERSRIQILSLILFGVVALIMLLAAVWAGLYFATRLGVPLGQLITAADRVSTGDLNARVEERIDFEEIASLARAFNRMTQQLASQRRELVDANQQLDQRRRFTEAVLRGVTAGVLGLDSRRRVVLPNRSAVQFLEMDQAAILGRPLDELLPELSPLIDRTIDGRRGFAEQQLVVARGVTHRTLLVRAAVQEEEGRIQGWVVTFDDVTDLLSAQRVAAWAEIARRLAHEIKNPLTPIRLSAERLQRRWLKQIEDEPDTFRGCTDTIVRHVDQIGRLVNEFSAFARMPEPVFQDERLAQIVNDAVLLQRTARPDIAFDVDLGRPELMLACDHAKVGQVLTNLLQNAIDAIDAKGDAKAEGREDREPHGHVRVRVLEEERAIIVQIEDDGVGLPPQHRERLFEPYVTTKAKGTGLGLAIVRKIMEEHEGSIDLGEAAGGGTSARLVFPRSSVVRPAA
ncbi:MAG TPA: PAS domain-containing sensor histidine kinase [Geminicoccus sp.]|uniref:sensor histidine kinase NtrY-like n=1 Tax=Geminicoccus sp. TaxID=2024832 RepID=UPI002CB22E8E|nr:PAS domain-containing sensor histidine kinase [Geminicoccus sp.]HWL70115.1 PAS domain-containing sensor histidine kinase [Geminicoccus sp.]